MMPYSLLCIMENGLNTVAIGIVDECSIIAFMILGADTGGARIDATGCQSLGMEEVHALSITRAERHMRSSAWTSTVKLQTKNLVPGTIGEHG